MAQFGTIITDSLLPLLTSFSSVFVGEEFGEGVKIFPVRELDSRSVSAGHSCDITNVGVTPVKTNYAQLPVG